MSSHPPNQLMQTSFIVTNSFLFPGAKEEGYIAMNCNSQVESLRLINYNYNLQKMA